mgnify:CR=1 FL=1
MVVMWSDLRKYNKSRRSRWGDGCLGCILETCSIGSFVSAVVFVWWANFRWCGGDCHGGRVLTQRYDVFCMVRTCKKMSHILRPSLTAYAHADEDAFFIFVHKCVCVNVIFRPYLRRRLQKRRCRLCWRFHLELDRQRRSFFSVGPTKTNEVEGFLMTRHLTNSYMKVWIWILAPQEPSPRTNWRYPFFAFQRYLKHPRTSS